MDALDLRVRNHVYHRFVDLVRAPTVDEVAVELELAQDETEAAFRRLHDAHALVLEPDSSTIRMLHPFSCVPTAHRVDADGRSWFASCAWDAFGIPAALGVDGRVSSACPDCGDAIAVEVVARRAAPDDLPVHFQVPAGRWWDDIVFT